MERRCVLPSATAPARRTVVRSAIEVIGCLASCAMFCYVRYVRHAPRTQDRRRPRLHAAERAWRSRCSTPGRCRRPPTRIGTLSWIAILILVYAMIAPSHAAADAAAASLAAASMDPLGVWHRRTARACRCRRCSTAMILSLAELRLRRDRHRCRRTSCSAWAGGCARRRSWAATSWSSCSGTAAWARSGAPSIACWRATRRSSWCGRRCSARATDDEATA